jgi:hypothetical protein
MPKAGVAPEVAAIRTEIRRFLDTLDSSDRKIGNAKFGAYAFYDYDAEPIYVGQTEEMLRSRIARHLTNQRTDAVAMNVLDPFEVAEIEVWPIYAAEIKGDIEKTLNSIEYTAFQKVLKESKLGAVLNEKDIPKTRLVKLPRLSEPNYSQRLIRAEKTPRYTNCSARIDYREFGACD